MSDEFENMKAQKDAILEKQNTAIAKKIIQAIWSDISGRSGGDHFLENCDDDIQQEIKDSWKAEILRVLKGAK